MDLEIALQEPKAYAQEEENSAAVIAKSEKWE